MAGQTFGVGQSGLGVPFFTGTGGTPAVDVPGKFEVGLNGVGYMVDTRYIDQWTESAVARTREQRDSSDEPGEQTMSPDDFWRRSPDGWHGGAGQVAFDDPASYRIRYETSKGIDPWTKDRLTLLPDTDEKRSSANTNLRLAVAGTRIYLLDGNSLYYATDMEADSPSFTEVTTGGTALSSPTTLVSDGFTVWAADGTATYYTTRTTGTYADYHSSSHPASLVRYAKGRLFTVGTSTNTDVIYTHSGTAGSATATAYYTHPNTDWTWTDITEGPNAIYFAGYSGDKSAVFRAAVVDTGADLEQPKQAGELPDGEIIRAIQGYLGFMLLGTDKGLRFAALDAQGDLAIGDLVEFDSPVEVFEPQDRFVWFEWKNYDSTSTGLGRIDLRTLNGTEPAYASDLMVTDQGDITGIATFDGLTVFVVGAAGVYAEDTNKVASGTIESGEIHFGIADPKDVVKVRIRHEAGAGTVQAAIAESGGSFQNVGGVLTTGSSSGSQEYPAQSVSSSPTFDVRLTLTRDSTDTTMAPVITRWTLFADPVPTTRRMFTVPLKIFKTVETKTGVDVKYGPSMVRQSIATLYRNGTVMNYQEGKLSHSVRISGYQWVAYRSLDQSADYDTDGTLIVELKVV